MSLVSEFSSALVFVLKRLLGGVPSTVRIESGPFGLELSVVSKEAGQSIDERLAKIDQAKQNLQEALDAINELHEKAETNRKELSALKRAVASAEEKRNEATSEVKNLRALASLDTGVVRQALGIPTTMQTWVERVLIFVLGVLASLLATWLWALF